MNLKRQRAKQWIGSVLFLAIAVAGLIAVSYLLRPVTGGSFRKTMAGFYAEKEDSLDLVVLGSSSAYRFFDTPVLWEQYGITSYNLATGSQPGDVVPYLMDEVEKTQSPQLYVIEVRRFVKDDEEDFSEVYFRRISDNMPYSINRFRMIRDLVPDGEDRLSYYFDLIKYHGNWETLKFKKSRLAYVDNEKKSALKGWSNLFQTTSLEAPTNYGDVGISEISQQDEEDLRKLLSVCSEKEIPVLFVATPWKMNKKAQQKTKYVETIINEYGFPFLDMNVCTQEIGLDFTTDFYDKKHVNSYGAEKVTIFFGKYLEEHYTFSKEHSAATKEEWDKAAAKNREEIAAYEEGDERTE